MKTLPPHLTHTETNDVSPIMSAEQYGNHGFPVLATPTLVGLFEKCAMGLMAPYLDADDGSVGTKVSIDHLAATPLGWQVTVTAKLVKVDRKRLGFELEASDGVDVIAKCRHERYLVLLSGFLDRLRSKAVNKPRVP